MPRGKINGVTVDVNKQDYHEADGAYALYITGKGAEGVREMFLPAFDENDLPRQHTATGKGFSIESQSLAVAAISSHQGKELVQALLKIADGPEKSASR